MGAGLAAVALGALPATASAELTPPNNDYERDNWVNVSVYDAATGAQCPTGSWWEYGCKRDSGNGATWSWKEAGVWSDSCPSAGVDFQVNGKGEGFMPDTEWGSQYPLTFCSSYSPTSWVDGTANNQLNWATRICLHKPSGEFWQIQLMEIRRNDNGVPNTNLMTFGRWIGTGSVSAFHTKTLQFGTSTSYAATDTKWEHKAEFKFGSEIVLVQTATPCGWGMLS